MSDAIQNEITECCICFNLIDSSSNNIDILEYESYIGMAILLNMDNNAVCKLDCCKKMFHISCLNEWLNKRNNCPMCREQILGRKKKSSHSDIIFHNISTLPRYGPILLEIMRIEQNSL